MVFDQYHEITQSGPLNLNKLEQTEDYTSKASIFMRLPKSASTLKEMRHIKHHEAEYTYFFNKKKIVKKER